MQLNLMRGGVDCPSNDVRSGRRFANLCEDRGAILHFAILIRSRESGSCCSIQKSVISSGDGFSDLLLECLQASYAAGKLAGGVRSGAIGLRAGTRRYETANSEAHDDSSIGHRLPPLTKARANSALMSISSGMRTFVILAFRGQLL
jgi:hypothetical protein